MSLLDEHIADRDITEKDVPISLELLYDLGWRFKRIEGNLYKYTKHPKMKFPIECGGAFNAYFMVNKYYPDNEYTQIKLHYSPDTLKRSGNALPSYIVGQPVAFEYEDRRIYTWYDLILIKQIAKYFNKIVRIRTKLFENCAGGSANIYLV